MEKEILNTHEAAAFLGFAPRYLENLARAKKVPSVKPFGRRGKRYFDRKKLTEFILNAGVSNESNV